MISTLMLCIILYCIVLYCTVLYCIVLNCTLLYCTVLYGALLWCTLHENEPREGNISQWTREHLVELLLGYWKSLLEAWTSKFEFCNFIGFSLNVIPVSGRHWARQVSSLTVQTPIDNLRSTTCQAGKFYQSQSCLNKRQFFVPWYRTAGVAGRN